MWGSEKQLPNHGTREPLHLDERHSSIDTKGVFARLQTASVWTTEAGSGIDRMHQEGVSADGRQWRATAGSIMTAVFKSERADCLLAQWTGDRFIVDSSKI